MPEFCEQEIDLKNFFKIIGILPIKYNNKICLMIFEYKEKVIIDPEKMLPIYAIKTIENLTQGETQKMKLHYTFETNTVTDEEMKIPDLSEYELLAFIEE